MAKEKKAKKAKEKGKGIIAEFKAFISRGSVLDMAVGVVIGGAFSAIVTAVVNILLSVCTWGVPGGLNGLITVLPAFPGSAAQAGLDPTIVATYGEGLTASLGQSFDKDALQALATAWAKATYGDATVLDNPALIESMKATITGKYTLYGTTYAYNLSAVINWGAVINAVISFLIIALVLFLIVKLVNTARKASDDLKAKAQEAYWEKHPEERPAPVDPGKPEPTDHELLKEMLKIMKENSAKKE